MCSEAHNVYIYMDHTSDLRACTHATLRAGGGSLHILTLPCNLN